MSTSPHEMPALEPDTPLSDLLDPVLVVQLAGLGTINQRDTVAELHTAVARHIAHCQRAMQQELG